MVVNIFAQNHLCMWQKSSKAKWTVL